MIATRTIVRPSASWATGACGRRAQSCVAPGRKQEPEASCNTPTVQQRAHISMRRANATSTRVRSIALLATLVIGRPARNPAQTAPKAALGSTPSPNTVAPLAHTALRPNCATATRVPVIATWAPLVIGPRVPSRATTAPKAAPGPTPSQHTEARRAPTAPRPDCATVTRVRWIATSQRSDCTRRAPSRAATAPKAALGSSSSQHTAARRAHPASKPGCATATRVPVIATLATLVIGQHAQNPATTERKAAPGPPPSRLMAAPLAHTAPRLDCATATRARWIATSRRLVRTRRAPSRAATVLNTARATSRHHRLTAALSAHTAFKRAFVTTNRAPWIARCRRGPAGVPAARRAATARKAELATSQHRRHTAASRVRPARRRARAKSSSAPFIARCRRGPPGAPAPSRVATEDKADPVALSRRPHTTARIARL